jgi:hypothetical protein
MTCVRYRTLHQARVGRDGLREGGGGDGSFLNEDDRCLCAFRSGNPYAERIDCLADILVSVALNLAVLFWGLSF